MRKKYGIFIVIFIILLAGLTVTLLNKFYSFDYLYNFIIRREFAINPRAEIIPEKEYKIRIWHYPFYRTIKDCDEKELFKQVKREVESVYPNIKLYVGEVDFTTGHEKLMEAINDGTPPDIYFNFSEYKLIDEKLQVPVSSYINKTEQEGYYTVNWNKISHRDKLWGWPTLVQNQYWIASKKLQLNQSKSLDFLRKVELLEKDSLLLNYFDQTLLRQLLTLVGLDTFKLEKDNLDIDTYRALEEVYNFLYKLKKDKVLYNDSTEVPNIFLKELVEGKVVAIGPINPYLGKFINEKMASEIDMLHLNILVQTYNLNIFRQKGYKGDDHTRAAMEVARIISQKVGPILAEDLGLAKAFKPGEFAENSNPQELLLINPEYKEYWKEVIIPVWLEFWEKDLTPEEVMARL